MSFGPYSNPDKFDHGSPSQSHGFRNTTYFQGAQNVQLVDSNILHVEGDYYTSSRCLTGILSLRQQISDSAMFDSGVRYPSGRCHPGTRIHVIDTLMAWIKDPSPSDSILWLHGSAGIGKSSIMQTIAEILGKEGEGLYAASFFFAHGVEGRQEGSALFPTLAYQIAVNFPRIGQLINQAMDLDHTLPTKSLPRQMTSLLVNPLTGQEHFQHTPTVLIDGLDECSNSAIQCQLLALISEAVSTDRIPLRFIIASRPEYWIQNLFERGTLQVITKKVSLDVHGYAPESTVNSDIAIFLRESFDEIYAKHSDLMENVKRPWPSSDIIDRLVYEASGQFIYASTIIRFVGHSSDFCDPVKQLDIILSHSSSSRPSAFSELDSLYNRILSAHPRPESMKTVLGGILLRLPLLHIQDLFGLDKSEVLITLKCLSSVVDRLEPPDSEGVDQDLILAFYPAGSRTVLKFFHKSFTEYLLDRRRSGAYWIDLDPLRKSIANTLFRSISASIGNQHTAKLEVIKDRNYYYYITRVLMDWRAGREQLLHLLHQMKARLERDNSSVYTSQPATLLRSLKCVQQLIGRHFMFEFHDFATITLTHGIYPRIVNAMHSCGVLKITDNLIYFSIPIVDLDYLPMLSSRLGNGGVAESPRDFLLRNADIISALNMPRHAGTSTQSYLLDPSIRSVLLNGTDKYKEYRLRYISIALRSLQYSLRGYHNDIKKFAQDIPWSILSFFLDTPQLSDILNEEDLRNTDFVALMNLMMALDTSPKRSGSDHLSSDPNKWRSLNGWRSRQQKDLYAMSILREFLPGLAHKIFNSVDHTLGPLGIASNFGVSTQVLYKSGLRISLDHQ